MVASLVAQTVKRLPKMRETQVQSLGQEDPLEQETATHSSILAWRTPWTEGNPLQHSCLENSVDRGKPTPAFLLGELRGQRSLVGYGPWGC